MEIVTLRVSSITCNSIHMLISKVAGLPIPHGDLNSSYLLIHYIAEELGKRHSISHTTQQVNSIMRAQCATQLDVDKSIPPSLLLRPILYKKCLFVFFHSFQKENHWMWYYVNVNLHQSGTVRTYRIWQKSLEVLQPLLVPRFSNNFYHYCGPWRTWHHGNLGPLRQQSL